MKIKEIKAREILDSRSNPTLEVTMILENGVDAVSSIPSGASTGSKAVIGYCIAGTLAVVVVRWGLRWARGIGR